MSIFLLSSHSGEKPAEDSRDAAARTIDLHRLRVFKQTDRGRKLRVLNRRSEAGEGLCVRDVRGHFKNFARQMLDSVYQTAPAGDKHARAGIIDEGFFFERALEQLEGLTQA